MSSDLLSPEYIGYQLEIFVALFTPLQVFAVALRFYARHLIRSTYGPEDWLVCASLFGQLAAGAIAIGEYRAERFPVSKKTLTFPGSVRQGGVGLHVGYVAETNPETLVNFFKYLVVIPIWYHATVPLAKLAILMLYRRLFPGRKMLIGVYITEALLICTAIASLVADFAACRPFEANWGPPEVQAVACINKQALFVWSTLPNIITDVVMLTLPLPVVWKLHTPTQLKVALTLTFLVGSL